MTNGGIEFKQDDRVAVLCQDCGFSGDKIEVKSGAKKWFYDGTIQGVGDPLEVAFNFQKDNGRSLVLKVRIEEVSSRVRHIRTVFFRGSFAAYQGQVGKVLMDCNSDYEVQLAFTDGSESSLLSLSEVEEATEVEYQKAQAAFCNELKILVSVTNLAGCAVVEPTEMQASTTVAEIKNHISLYASQGAAVQVHLQDGDVELSDHWTLERFQESGAAELFCALSELSISDADRSFYMDQLSRAKRRSTSEIERVFSLLDDAARADTALVHHAVGQHGLLLRHAHRSAQANREIVLKAVGLCGQSLEFADPSLKADRYVALIAARSNCKSIAFAHAALRANASFVLEAGGSKKKWNPEVLAYAGPTLWEDVDFVRAVASRNKRLLELACQAKYGVPADLITKKHLVLVIIQQSPDQLCFAAESLKKDMEVILEAVRRSGETLRHAHDEMKKDRFVVTEAVRQNPQALRHAHPSLQMTGMGGRQEALKKLLR